MPVIDVFHAAGRSSVTSCGRASGLRVHVYAGPSGPATSAARVMKVGAPLIIAKSASTQLFRTVISWLKTR